MTTRDASQHHAAYPGSVESWLVSAGRDRRPGSPLNVPPWPASNFVLGDQRAYEHLPATLLRLSVGIEAVEDLWTDLDRALNDAAGR